MNEHILETYRKYCTEEKYYEAYSYVLDYHELLFSYTHFFVKQRRNTANNNTFNSIKN